MKQLKYLFVTAMILGLLAPMTSLAVPILPAVTFHNPTASSGDEFGVSVSGIGNNVLIGAYRDEDESGGVDSGAAYLFNKAGGLITTITNPNTGSAGSNDLFGSSTAEVNGKILIGAPDTTIGLTAKAGAVYLFNASGSLLTTINNPNPETNAQFGASVAGMGDNILVGAPGGSPANGGQVYLYDSSGTQLTVFNNPTPASGDQFGKDVGVVGNLIIIGAPKDDTEGTDAGEVYVFDTAGTLLSTLLPSGGLTAGDEFGSAVSGVGSDRILVGAPNDDTGASNAGRVFLFNSGGAWLLSIDNPTPGITDCFGFSVDEVAGNLLVGSVLDDDGAVDAGDAYLFSQSGGLISTFGNPNPFLDDEFGFSVAAAGHDILVGVIRDDEDGADTGIAYLYTGEPNTAPVVAAIANQVADENTAFSVAVSATDVNNDALTLVASNVPSFCSFTDHADGTGTFNCSPGYSDAGGYTNVTVTASDGFAGSHQQSFDITINNVNQPPSVTPIGSFSVTEGSSITVFLLATDPEADPISFVDANLPAYCVFTVTGGGGANLVCSPPLGSAGGTPIISTITTSATGGSVIQNFVVTVISAPLAPELCTGVDTNGNGLIDEGFPAGNTPCGNNINVIPNGVTTLYDLVTLSGNTTDVETVTNPVGAVPANYSLGTSPLFHQISTTAIFSGNVKVCVNYTPVNFGNESNLELLHHNGTNWELITISKNAANDQICGNTTSFSPFVVVELPSSTWVSLAWFSADSNGSTVNLGWETAGEIDNEGFNLYRAKVGGIYEPITARLIPARGIQPDGAIYHFIDEGVTPGTEYAYMLEDVDRFGVKTLHGPLPILVADGAQGVYTEPESNAAVAGDGAVTDALFFGAGGGGCSVSKAPATWGDAAGTLLLLCIPLAVMMVRNRRRKAA